MDQDKPTEDDLERVKVTIKALQQQYLKCVIDVIDPNILEEIDPSVLDGKRIIITVPLTKRDYRKAKEAFDKGELKTLGILGISAEPLEAAEPEQTGFAKTEKQKRVARKKSDSTPDHP